MDRGRGRTPPLRSAWQGVPAWNPPVSFADSPLEARGPRGRGLRIATTGVRTGLAMTRCKECRGRADVGIGPYGRVQEVPALSAGGVEPRPYGGMARSACVESPSQLR